MKRYIRAENYNSFEFNSTSKTAIQAISNRLNVNTDVAKFIADLHSADIDDNGFTTEEECIDYIVKFTTRRMEEILLNEGYNGLVHWYGNDYADKFIEVAKALGIDVDDYL